MHTGRQHNKLRLFDRAEVGLLKQATHVTDKKNHYSLQNMKWKNIQRPMLLILFGGWKCFQCATSSVCHQPKQLWWHRMCTFVSASLFTEAEVRMHVYMSEVLLLHGACTDNCRVEHLKLSRRLRQASTLIPVALFLQSSKRAGVRVSDNLDTMYRKMGCMAVTGVAELKRERTTSQTCSCSVLSVVEQSRVYQEERVKQYMWTPT